VRASSTGAASSRGSGPRTSWPSAESDDSAENHEFCSSSLTPTPLDQASPWPYSDRGLLDDDVRDLELLRTLGVVDPIEEIGHLPLRIVVHLRKRVLDALRGVRIAH